MNEYLFVETKNTQKTAQILKYILAKTFYYI